MSGVLNSIYSNTGMALSNHSTAIAKLQEKASTGSRINRASDDPSDAYKVLNLNTHKRSTEHYISSIEDVISTLEMASSVVNGSSGNGGMVQSLSEVRSRITQVFSGTYSDTARKQTAQGINDILEQMVSLANTEHQGEYLFGGADTSSKPFTVNKTDGKITSVEYQGSSKKRNIQIAPGMQSSAYQVGSKVFASDRRQDPQLLSEQTGVQLGSGTTNTNGFTWLNVTKDSGTGHYQLYLDDPSKTIDIDPANDNNNIAVKGSDGQVLYVNAQNIESTGTELVSTPGTHDIFNTLITLRDVLENNKNLPDNQVKQLTNKAVDALDELESKLLENTTVVGTRINFLDDLKNGLEDVKLNNEEETSRISEADIAQVAIDLERRQVLYQMSLSVAGKLMSMSLLNFIQ